MEWLYLGSLRKLTAIFFLSYGNRAGIHVCDKNKVVDGKGSAVFWRLGESLRDLFGCKAIERMGKRWEKKKYI